MISKLVNFALENRLLVLVAAMLSICLGCCFLLSPSRRSVSRRGE